MLPRYSPHQPGVIIYDNDDTLIDSGPYVEKFLQQWIADNIGISPELAFAQLSEGYRLHNDSYGHVARLNDLPPDWPDKASITVHQALADQMEDFVEHNPHLLEQFRQLQAQGHIIGILSQARRVYLDRSLAIMELLQVLHPQLVMAYECVGGHLKRKPEPYRTVLHRTAEIAPGRWHLMVDDSPGNLPCAADEGFTTALVGKHRSASGKFIHTRHTDVYDLNEAMLNGTFKPQYN